MLSEELEITLNRAFKQAREKRHEFMTVEHLLLALLDNPTSNSALKACGADLQQLQNDLNRFLDETTPTIPENEEREIEPTLGFQRVKKRLLALTYWWPSSVNKNPKRCICSANKTSPVWM
jgi:ATP-dependent Clp protease ATP-binding subunit ClpA